MSADDQEPDEEPLQSIRTGRVSRGFAIAKLTMGAGLRVTGHAVSGLFTTKENRDERKRDLLLRQAADLTRELGELKGSMMKVGQMLSTYGEALLPAEANAVLKSLQSTSPTLRWEVIEERLLDELGEDRLGELDIEETPLAAASLGQVHAAVIRASGERVAVKVQYPGVDKAVDADLSTLRQFLRVAGLAPTGPSAAALFSEVRSMLQREVDYSLERETTDSFASAFVEEPRLWVPRTYPRFSTPRVLTTELIEGVRFDAPAVAELSQERRDALGELVFEMLLREVFVLRAVQTDPHMGNFLVRIGADHDRVGLLDFGAVRAIGDDVMGTYVQFIAGAVHQSAPPMEAVGRAMGFLRDGDPDELRQRFVELCLLVVEPFADPNRPGGPPAFMDAQGRYDWGATDLPSRLAAKGKAGVLAFKLRTPPAWTFFLDRKLGGVYMLLSVLGARFDGRALVTRFIDAYGAEWLESSGLGAEPLDR
ncbi:MAG: AarF/ABC1/UbiB kinase family protein [Deltaproteobacteria bacterium]|nr:AarF/ABC1/UbiB kinase family protein [Deltaproteobacteria bacterium]